MISVDASAAAIALVTEPRSGRAAAPNPNMLIHAGDRFAGSYRCAQGATDLTLVLGAVGEGPGEVSVEATASFHVPPAPGRSGEDGSFSVRGTFDPRSRRLHLRGAEWIVQPSNYQLVSFLGRVEKKGASVAFGGTVDGHQCTTFSTELDGDDDVEEP